jgi:hypothetical protein
VSYFLPVLAIGLASVPAGVLAWSAAARHAGPLKFLAAVAIAAVLPAWLGLAAERRVTFARFDALVRSMWERIPDEPGYVLWGDDMSTSCASTRCSTGAAARSPWWIRCCWRTAPHASGSRGSTAWSVSRAQRPWRCRSRRPRRPRSRIRSRVCLNDATPLPVYVFDPARQSVRRLLKPGA